MAKEQPNFTMAMLQEGFSHVDRSMAQDDPEMGAMIDGLISKLAGPMAKRMGIDGRALAQLTMQIIRGRARETMSEETQTREGKMAVAEGLGRATRAADMKLEGIRMTDEAFQKQILFRYVGAAMSAAGSFIGQGIASGLFEGTDMSLDKGVEQLQDLSDQTSVAMDTMDTRVQAGQLDASIKDLAARPGALSGENLLQQNLSPGELQMEPMSEVPTFRGMQPRHGGEMPDGPNTEQSIDPSAFGTPRFETHTDEMNPIGEASDFIKRQKDLGSHDVGNVKGTDPLAEMSGMRQKKEKDKFAGLGNVLQALRGV